MAPEQDRRKQSAAPRKKGERRGDMKIIVSASEADIYTWAVSIALMAVILVVFVMMALIGVEGA
ncbi:MAG: hypothetical protein OSB62_05390 [Alphaproteobacteria bacterium]|jgi:hypothetical protein|nr:hypothetical protein [Alphaproteobacteria bacterium]